MCEIRNTSTYVTKYGAITLYDNDMYITQSFKSGGYWDEDTSIKLKKYINPNTNILEIGGHCGTSTLIYSSFISDNNKCYVYEPQKRLYDLLVKNINQNNLQEKIKPFNKGVFCFDGVGNMDYKDQDMSSNGGGVVSRRYNDESHMLCNFAGVGLGSNGERVSLTTIDNMDIDNIGLIHCDAQGSEDFIFSKAIRTITKYRPVIIYKNKETYGNYLYNIICESYPEHVTNFNIKSFCMNELGYYKFIEGFNGGFDTLLIP